MLSARDKNDLVSPSAFRRTVEKNSTLRTRGREKGGRLGLWVQWRHRKAGQMPTWALPCRHGCCRPNRGPCRDLSRAGRQAQERARKLAALSQPSSRPFQQHSAPGRPLLNLPLRLRCWHPTKSKITIIPTAQRGERGTAWGEEDVEAYTPEKHLQGGLVRPPPSPTAPQPAPLGPPAASKAFPQKYVRQIWLG